MKYWTGCVLALIISLNAGNAQQLVTTWAASCETDANILPLFIIDGLPVAPDSVLRSADHIILKTGNTSFTLRQHDIETFDVLEKVARIGDQTTDRCAIIITTKHFRTQKAQPVKEPKRRLDARLCVINGVIVAADSVTNPLEGINPRNIKSIILLNDIAISPIYCVRPAKDVLIVSTKRRFKNK